MHLFILIGPSAVGKTTVMEHLLEHPELGLVRFCTTTTRAPREGEQSGIQYEFVSPEAFETMIHADLFFEWTEIYGHRYGTNKEVLRSLRTGNRPIICVLEPEGARKIKAADPKHTTIIFLKARREDLLGRLEQRHMTEADLEKRIARIDRELALYPTLADIVIENNDGQFDTTVEKITELIKTSL